jgi:asparagine N-glycosylation enzyme membrane subunit Stt3
MKRLLFGLPLISTAATMLAQTTTDTPADVSGAAVAGVFGVTCIFMLLGVAVWLGIAIWIMRDAKKRNSPNATLVTVLGFLVPLVGLIVHLVTRPKTIPGGNP